MSRVQSEKPPRILFAIQGTGNGHLSRARDIYPELCRYGTVDVLVSGIQADMDVPFPITYRKYGLSFIFGKKGGVDIRATAVKLKLFRLLRDICLLPVKKYSLVINDFEPVSAWACRLKGVPCIGLSHQSAVLSPNAPKPQKKDRLGILVLQHYAPVKRAYGFHFNSYEPHIFTPVIRKEVRQLDITNEGHYTVYLPAYDDETIVSHLSQFQQIRWDVFSKHNKQPFKKGNVSVMPIDNDLFLESMAAAQGVICGAGFETPAEALFLKKKLLVIPMEGQYEQQCNAAALGAMGVTVASRLSRKYNNRIAWWLVAGDRIPVSYPDNAADAVARIMEDTGYALPPAGATVGNTPVMIP